MDLVCLRRFFPRQGDIYLNLLVADDISRPDTPGPQSHSDESQPRLGLAGAGVQINVVPKAETFHRLRGEEAWASAVMENGAPKTSPTTPQGLHPGCLVLVLGRGGGGEGQGVTAVQNWSWI